MKLGLNVSLLPLEADELVGLARFAEELGYGSVWTAEGYGPDAVVPATWIAARTSRIDVGTAIMQMPGRTPANTAMTAATLDHMSQGRFRLGLGLSGPQVVEGWHGAPFPSSPLGFSEEYVSIVRDVLRREDRLEHRGRYFEIPYEGDDASGLGRPLKLILHPHRSDLPIYLAAIGPRNVELSGRIADGWLPVFFSPHRFDDVYGPMLEDRPEGFDIAPTVHVVMGDDVDACREVVKPTLALYVGGMGSRGKNFYNDLACRYGFEAEAERIQDLYLSGEKEAAAAAVPDRLVDEVALCGPPERLSELIAAWKDSPVTTMICSTGDRRALEVLAELVL